MVQERVAELETDKEQTGTEQTGVKKSEQKGERVRLPEAGD